MIIYTNSTIKRIGKRICIPLIVLLYFSFSPLKKDKESYSNDLFSLPSVSIEMLSNQNITYYSAFLIGNVISNGGEEITEVGFVYSSTDSSPSIGENNVIQVVINPIQLGVFQGYIAPLTPSTGYYVSSYAINASGITYSTVTTFTTKSINEGIIGNEVQGNDNDQRLGTSVDINDDGSRVVVSSAEGGTSNDGFVEVYHFNTGWSRLGDEITGGSGGESFGSSIAINSLGDIIVIGAPSEDTNGTDAGKVYVFEYDSVGDEWIQLGSALLGSSGDLFGSSVDINATGSRIAVGAKGASGSGAVIVYEYNGTSWVQLGATLNGGASDLFGSAIKMDSLGEKLIVGAPSGSNNGTDSGYIQTYQYTGSQWTQYGSTINGDSAGDQFGHSVSMDSSGNVIAIGAPYDDISGTDRGAVKIYEYNSTWQQKGVALEGKNNNDLFGYSVSISGNGNELVAGAPDFSSKTGMVEYFFYEYSDWSSISLNIQGDAPENVFGTATSISRDGSRFIIGAPSPNTAGGGILGRRGRGYVAVYASSQLPLVNTQPLSQAATFNGQIAFNGWDDITEKGIVYSAEEENPEIGLPDVIQIPLGSGEDDFDTNIIYNLTANTEYSIRAYGINNVGTSYSKVYTYLTGNSNSLTTNVNNTTSGTANIGGTILDDNGDTPIERGIVYSQTNTNPEINGSGVTKVVIDSSNSNYSQTITSLLSGTTYYTKAYIVNGSGTTYGSTVSFTTGDAPELTLNPTTQITSNSATLHASIISSNDVEIEATGFVYSSTDSNPEIAAPGVITIINGNEQAGSITISNTIAALTFGTTFYVKAYITLNTSETYYSSVDSFTTNLINISTNDSSDLTINSVTIGGNISDNGGNSITTRGVVYSSTNMDPELGSADVINQSDALVGLGSYSLELTGLSNSTTYYYKAYGINNTGTYYGEVKQFTTYGPVVISTSNINSVTINSALLGGVISDTGGATIEERGMVYSSIDSTPEIGETGVAKEINNSGLNTFLETITSLETFTTYYARAYAISNSITYYGEVKQFTTLNGSLGILTASESNLTLTSAVLNGTITDVSDGAVTEKGFVYSQTNQNPTINGFDVIVEVVALSGGSSEVGSYNTAVFPLLFSNYYYYRAYAKNANGITYGDTQSFITSILPNGSNPIGAHNNEYFGASHDINTDGSIVAITTGDGNQGVPPTSTPNVYVFTNTAGDWNPVGPTLPGENSVIESGGTISLNADGTRIAIGLPNVGPFVFRTETGNIRVYEYNGTSWSRIGQSIDAIADSDDTMGLGLDLNASGDIVAIGNRNSQLVQVYQYNNVSGSWEQLGNDISFGESSGNLNISLNSLVRLNDVGDVIAIGAPFNTAAAGEVRVYRYNGSAWIEEVQFMGETSGDLFGHSLDLNSAGSILSVGAPENNGRGAIYNYSFNSETSNWQLMGTPLMGPESDENFGASVSIDGSGRRLVTMSFGDEDNSNDGHYESNDTYIYDYDPMGETWARFVGEGALTLDTSLSTSGILTSPTARISKEGTLLGLADPREFLNGTDLGSVYYYTVPSFPVVNTKQITERTFSSGTIEATISSNGELSIIESGIVFSDTNSNPLIDSLGVDKAVNTVSLGDFTTTISNLSPETKYYYRSYAVNAYTISYGALDSITTRKIIELSTEITETTTNMTSLGGNITEDGGDTIIQRGIVYAPTSLNTNPEIGGSNVSEQVLGVGLGAFTQGIELELDTEYVVKAYAINQGGTVYGLSQTFTTYDGIITFSNPTNFGSWSDSNNWDHVRTPEPYDEVHINASSLAVLDTDVSINKLFIEPGATVNGLVINPGGSITIETELNNNGTISMQSGGSLIVNGTAINGVDSKISYSRTLPSSNWHLITPVISGDTVEDFLIRNNDIATGNGFVGIIYFDNSSPGYDGEGWHFYDPSSTGPMDNAIGYGVKLNDPGTIRFEGSGVFNDTDINISNGSVNDYNFIGNPYTSYIPANENADNINNILRINEDQLDEMTIWVWDQATSEYLVINHETSSRHLAPSQGFFVRAKENLNNGVFSYTKLMQSHQTDVFNRNAESQLNPNIKIKVSDTTSVKSTTVFYSDDATSDFDNGRDSSLFGASLDQLYIYTKLVSNSSDNSYAIQSVSKDYEALIIPIGVNIPSSSTVTFSVGKQNFPEDVNVYIEDRELNTFILLEDEGSEYEVTFNEEYNGAGRFYLHTTYGTLSTTEEEPLSSFEAYFKSENTLNIAGIYEDNVFIKVYNLLGKQMFKSKMNLSGNDNIEIPSLLKGGIYILTLNYKHVRLSKKVYKP